LVNEATHQPVT